MSVGAQQVVCPHCDDVVDVTVGGDREAVDAGVGHVESDSAVNQLCTSCLDKIHVVVE
jgi:hypothetical protein